MKNIEEKVFSEISEEELEKILSIVFQPVYSLEKNKIVSYEVLSRFALNNISTIEIIEQLEMMDKIHLLDFLVLKKVEKYLKKSNVKLAVNISFKTMLKNEFLSKLSLLKGTKNLIIELVERGTFDYDDLNTTILFLNELGIKVVMDDFPIGSSNRENFIKAQINDVKIDKNLLKNINQKKEKNTYTNIISFLKTNNSIITAEGVETSEELEFLKKINVDLVQGYFIGKPISENEFSNFFI
ncbi:EAL domain-containing protein [Cetobacterium sp. 2G large]|uniref:EAL domain-containing protein n=1 Tax=Cetobacterium sp. 2G large TaxID=2759680 RepID=UPI00163BADDB|nr:EAL domain-containing protein [Cetobacterium sp. 2G large]MBC2854521.1 EAL domain-containing protein [Cetobacterium sp. 2G large]